ncbi:MAG: CxxxxCH/CxxCH domain-containing protein [Desulfuromonas sp.]|nr:CxxxxCH/CxxCH domain-containing protein [Desulfuromonas sp.]
MTDKAMSMVKHWVRRILVVTAVVGMLTATALSGSAEAAVTSAKAWAGVTGGNGNTSLATLPATAYTVGTGSNRLLVAALTVEYTAAATLINPVVTYGGKTLTQLGSSCELPTATRGWMTVWVGYLKEADIAGASGTNLVASWVNSANSVSNANLFAATYAGVSQTQPVPLNSGYSVNADTATNATALTFRNNVSYADGGMVFYATADSGTSTTMTQATGFTASLAPVNYGARGSVFTAANKSSNSPAGTAASTLSVTWSGSTAYSALVVAALNPDTVTSEPGYVTIPDGQSANGNPLTLAPVPVSSGDQVGYQTDQTGLVYRAVSSKSDGFHGTILDSKWVKSDIGGFASAAPAIVDGDLQLNGRGNINNTTPGTTDSLTYLYQNNATGSFTIDVRVDSLLNTNTAAKAGIMVRASTATNSMYAGIFVTPGSGAMFGRRTTAGGTAAFTTTTGITPPRWLRLVRNGNVFSAFQSADGNTWTQVGANVTITMTDPVLAGLAVSSQSTTLDTRARFDNYLYMPASTSGMTTTWTAVATSIVTNDGGALTDWTAGVYGVSLRNGATGAVVDTNLFNYSPCVDVSPSAITIPASQTVKGGNVSLPALYTAAGNVGSFTYKINGTTVTSPWNSYALVPAGTSANVTLQVSGTDPDCGGKVVTASQTIAVDNTCIDGTPSTITIRTGQVAGGPAIDLTRLFTKTGNVGSFTYKINGTPVTSPWSSMAYGVATPEMVTLEVHGTDPDCGGSLVNAVNQIEIDNRCVRNPPSISFDDDEYHVGKGRAIPVKVTFRNEDTYGCGSSTFSLAVASDSNLTDFNPSYFNPVGSNSNVTLGGREARTIELVVSAKAAAVDWQVNNTKVEITSSYASHNLPAKTSGIAKSTVFLVSPITHNSVTTHSTKWSGKWGTSETGAKYGNFDCMICHEKGGPNIKWLRGSVSLPEWGGGGPVTRTVVMKDANAGSNNWGNDDPAGADIQPDSKAGAGRTGSNRVCEVCHSITLHHRFDTEIDPDGAGPLTKQTDGYTHFNNRDCTDCHRHSGGFTADCTGCHGNPPLEDTHGGPNGLAKIPGATGSTTPGTHYKHTVVLGFPCEYCHNGWRNEGEMPKTVAGGKQQINHVFNVFYDLGMTDPERNSGHYTGQDGVNYTPYQPAIDAGIQAADGTILPGRGTMTCETIYCHGGFMGGTSPQWNSNVTCNACHGTTVANPPPGRSHQTHVSKQGLACTDCHGSTPAPGSNGHVNGRVKWDLTGLKTKGKNVNGDPLYKSVQAGSWTLTGTSNADGSDMPPSNIYGSCRNISCHMGRETPPWNNNGNPATCTSCHNDGSDTGLLADAAPATGNHAQHARPAAGTIDEKMINAFVNKCESCHGGGANTGSHVGHSDGAVTFGGGMTYSLPSGSGGTCTSQCHDLKGLDALNNPVAITWGSTNALSCEACHEAPYIGPTVVDPAGVGGTANGMAASGYGSHLKQQLSETFSAATNWGAQCKKCHPFHEGSAVMVPEIPATATFGGDLGVDFPITGGIHLGGSATTRTTEAEICWECHANAANTVTRTASMTIVSAASNSSFVDAGNGLGNFKVGRYVRVGGATAQANNGYFKIKTVNAGSLFVDATLTAQATASSITLVDEISEWGANAPLSTSPLAAQSPYDYGALYTDTTTSAGTRTANWTTGFWRSGRGGTSTDMFWYKRGRIQSTHSANFTSGTSAVAGSNYAKTETRDAVGDIRCSYCHDVHDRNHAIDVGTGAAETYTGRPYLRGSWNANPYEEDGAPQTGTTYFNTQRFGAVPRGNGASQRSLGGFWIDINNVKPGTAPKPAGATAADGTAAANPTSGWTLNGSAGLCMTCHSADKSGNPVTVDTMDYDTSDTNWISTGNGHANAVIGGTGSGATNIFNLRGSTTGCSTNPVMHFQGCNAPNDGGNTGFRNGGTSRYNYTPSLNPASTENNQSTTPPLNNWGTITIDAATVNSQYHKFSCSKCHNPHASRLPKLMITNCLDTKHNTWDDSYQLNATTGINANRSLSNWSSAQNCHRLGGIADGTGPEAVDTGAVGATQGTGTDYSNRGWNVVTPWTSGPPQ